MALQVLDAGERLSRRSERSLSEDPRPTSTFGPGMGSSAADSIGGPRGAGAGIPVSISPTAMTGLPRRSALAGLFGRSLLLTQDWSTRDLDTLLGLASRLEALDRAGKRTALLPDQLAYALFFDNSTRTKSAWAGAAARLGMPR